MVVAIILIIAAIALPNFLRAKITANESSAVSSVHAVNTARSHTPACLAILDTPRRWRTWGRAEPAHVRRTATASCFIDPTLATGTKSGFNFTYVQNASATPAIQFTINADPVSQGITGQKGFYSDESNIIRYASPGPANLGSAPL